MENSMVPCLNCHLHRESDKYIAWEVYILFNPIWLRHCINVTNITVDDFSLLLLLFRQGKLDVFIYDTPVIEYRMANDPECNLVSVGKPFGEEGYGIGVQKGKLDNVFIALTN